jgi:hypothetical protein
MVMKWHLQVVAQKNQVLICIKYATKLYTGKYGDLLSLTTIQYMS